MQAISQHTFIGIILRIHHHPSPLTCWPIVPILHYHIKRYSALTILTNYVKKFLGTAIAFFRLSITKEITWHHRALTCQPPIVRHYRIHGRSLHEIIIYLPCRFHLYITTVCHIIINHGTTSIKEQSIACGRVEHRNHCLKIVLAEIHFLATQIHIILHVGTKSIEGFGGGPVEIRAIAEGAADSIATQHVHHRHIAIGGMRSTAACFIIGNFLLPDLLRTSRTARMLT